MIKGWRKTTWVKVSAKPFANTNQILIEDVLQLLIKIIKSIKSMSGKISIKKHVLILWIRQLLEVLPLGCVVFYAVAVAYSQFIFLWKCTRQQCIYLCILQCNNNSAVSAEPTKIQFTSGYSNHVSIILRVHNIVRELR